MPVTDGVFPLLMLLLLTIFAAGVALDHQGVRRRPRRRTRHLEERQ